MQISMGTILYSLFNYCAIWYVDIKQINAFTSKPSSIKVHGPRMHMANVIDGGRQKFQYMDTPLRLKASP